MTVRPTRSTPSCGSTATRRWRAAAAADERRAAGGDLPPLLGVPIGLKDLYEVAGNRSPPRARSSPMCRPPTATCGSGCGRPAWCCSATPTPTSSRPVARPTRSATRGTSPGRPADRAAVREPRSRHACCPPRPGTDTAGSLRIPSACCGTSTIKPTRGYVSTAGIVPLSWSLDHAGPMARSVADCRALLGAMIGPDRGRAESALHAAFGDPGAGIASVQGARIAISPRVATCRARRRGGRRLRPGDRRLPAARRHHRRARPHRRSGSTSATTS